ncbi:hypothetical protein NC652_038955 [Populus alba x Populus x berolinensis]|nr:hypothetical protein NC651_037922 [Populus alba x Populus x berolinensis]KAJ6861982.1 hypothetical protein NC652_038955 [Populus alba x Populus x berolinensis]
MAWKLLVSFSTSFSTPTTSLASCPTFSITIELSCSKTTETRASAILFRTKEWLREDKIEIKGI